MYEDTKNEFRTTFLLAIIFRRFILLVQLIRDHRLSSSFASLATLNFVSMSRTLKVNAKETFTTT